MTTNRSGPAGVLWVTLAGLVALSTLITYPLQTLLVIMLCVWWGIRHHRKVKARMAQQQALAQYAKDHAQSLTFLNAEDRKWLAGHMRLAGGAKSKETP